MNRHFREDYEGYYLVDSTGDVLEYVGETLTDYHKGEYDSRYKVVIADKLILNGYYARWELYDENRSEYLTLTKIPTDIDIKTINVSSLKLLYSKKQ